MHCLACAYFRWFQVPKPNLMQHALARGTCALRTHLTGRTQRRTARSLVAVRSMATAPSKFQILDYKYVNDILEKRGPHREAHLDAVRAQGQAGKLVIAGAAGDPVSGGLLIFQNTSKEEIEAFVKADPYVKADLVSSWEIRPLAAAAGTALDT